MGLGNIDVNVHSATLSRAFHPDEHEESEESNNDEQSDNLEKKALSLGLSGTFNVHLSAPQNDEGIMIPSKKSEPLFLIGKTSKKTPSVQVGANYDFDERWHGITRFFSTVSWNSLRFRKSSMENGRQNQPINLHVTTEAGITKPNDYSIEVVLEQPESLPILNLPLPLASNPTTISARIDTLNSKATLSLQKPVHRRFNILSISTFCFAHFHNLRSSSTSFLTRAMQRSLASKMPPLDDPDSIIPRFQLGGTRQLLTTSEIGWNKESLSSKNIKFSDLMLPGISRLGMRFVISKKMDWGMPTGFHFLGNNEEDDDGEVSIRMEIMGLEQNENVLNSIIMNTRGSYASDLLVNSHFTFSREQILDLN